MGEITMCEPVELYNLLNQSRCVSRLAEINYLCLIGEVLPPVICCPTLHTFLVAFLPPLYLSYERLLCFYYRCPGNPGLPHRSYCNSKKCKNGMDFKSLYVHLSVCHKSNMTLFEKSTLFRNVFRFFN